MPTDLLLVDTGPGEPGWNMAFDEALLETAPGRDAAVLRFYGWTEPAATFGYSQRYAEVARLTLLRPLVRRPTGGGIVPHDRDWTYSLAVPPGHPWYRLRAIESYRTMHAWIVAAFARMQIATELAPTAVADAPGQCFRGHEPFDVLWHGRKIAGAAQRRNRLGLLIQGSVQPPPRLSRDDWQTSVGATAPTEFFARGLEWRPNPGLLEKTTALVEARYGQQDFHTRR